MATATAKGKDQRAIAVWSVEDGGQMAHPWLVEAVIMNVFVLVLCCVQVPAPATKSFSVEVQPKSTPNPHTYPGHHHPT